MIISPWDNSVDLVSPNGLYRAVIESAGEVRMGAPTMGDLHLSTGRIFELCNPSLIWSDDFAYLAVPQWRMVDLMQRLLIISINRAEWRYSPGIYHVLELHEFSKGIVRGIDSPIRPYTGL
jgi:hypothetical protein